MQFINFKAEEQMRRLLSIWHDNGDPHEIHYFELVNEEKQLVLAEKYTKGKRK